MIWCRLRNAEESLGSCRARRGAAGNSCLIMQFRSNRYNEPMRCHESFLFHRCSGLETEPRPVRVEHGIGGESAPRDNVRFVMVFSWLERSFDRTLQPAEKHQYEQNQDNEPHAAARVIPPALAVWPRGLRAHKHEDQDNQQDCSDRHGVPPFVGPLTGFLHRSSTRL